MLPKLTKEDFDPVIRSGKDLILFFYKEDDAVSYIVMSALNDIDKMHGKNFLIRIIPTDSEPEIACACDVSSVPELITIKGKKIYKRAHGILKSNQILDMLK